MVGAVFAGGAGAGGFERAGGGAVSQPGTLVRFDRPPPCIGQKPTGSVPAISWSTANDVQFNADRLSTARSMW